MMRATKNPHSNTPGASEPSKALTIRQRAYLKGLAAGRSKYRAALDAGYSESVARTAKAHIEKENVQDALKRLMRRAVPAEELVRRIAGG